MLLRRPWIPLLLLLGPMLGGMPTAGAQQPDDQVPLVYAAASLTDVLQRIGADYQRDGQRRVRLSFGSTATLARQIESGARADLFLSADEEWMDYVEQRGLTRRDSRVDLLGNRLVLIAPAGSDTRLELAPGVALAAALGPRGRLALADPSSVPAGKYAKSAMIRLGAWEQVAKRHVAAENVRMALLFVARGEAPLGIVYRTDALAEPRVRVVAEFPAATHAPIVYPAALTQRARPGTAAFLEYLAGPAARARFEAAGFTVLASERSAVIGWPDCDRDIDEQPRLFQAEARQLTAGADATRALPRIATRALQSLRLASQRLH